ncbi:armadillo repeat-containing protein 1-like isoform X1 [Hyperolius riggenbachi]|uniref:armadillo repeat-containing protein 1-like isoform X1 n=1 Tax=Hyperolius riggenbachi TaxID=752182 RepID=UPI0035A2F01B
MDAVSVVSHLKLLASNPRNRDAIVKDKSCLAGLILFLGHQDAAVIEGALQTFCYLCENTDYCETLRSELGMIASLESLINRCDVNYHIRQRAQTVYRALAPSVAMHTPEQRCRKSKTPFFFSSCNKRAKTVTLHIHGLDLERKSLCEEALLKVKGVISFTFQITRRRCMVRVQPELATECLTSAIAETKVLKAQQVITTESGNEVLLPASSMNIPVQKNQCLPEYLPEEESPQKDLEKALAQPASKEPSNGSWINAAASFLSKTFYW